MMQDMGGRMMQVKHIVAAALLAGGFSPPVLADAARQAELMEQLRTAETPRAAELILREIVAEWSRSGSATVDLLLQRGTEALEAGDWAAAVDHLTAAIDHAPDFAEAYHDRATAYYQLGEIGPALDDLRQTLVLNPDHFGALQGFAVILGELGREDEALEVFARVLDLNPHAPDVADVIERLSRDLAGRAL
jgi:tetratricopeptide (TPR) repeat protein